MLTSLTGEFRALAQAFLGVEAPEQIIDRFRTTPAEVIISELETMQNALYELLPRLLPKVVLPVPSKVPISAEARSPLGIQARLTLQGRRLTPELVGTRTDSLALAMLDDLFRRPRRCPLWACEICGVVVAQPARGRLARFCSSRCKARGIPSASRRAQYVAEHRRRRREEDLAKSREATKGVPQNKQYEALRAALPGRPRKALVHLLRIVRREKEADGGGGQSYSSAKAAPVEESRRPSRSQR